MKQLKGLLFISMAIILLYACKKDSGVKNTPIPDLTQTITVFIQNDSPTKFDTINGLLYDTISFSIPHITISPDQVRMDTTAILRKSGSYGTSLSINPTNPSCGFFSSPAAFRMYLKFPDSSYFVPTIFPAYTGASTYDSIYPLYSIKYNSVGAAPSSQINFWRKYAIDGAVGGLEYQNPYYGVYQVSSSYNGFLDLKVNKKQVINNSLYISGIFIGGDSFYEKSTWNSITKTFSEQWSFSGTFTNLKWN